MVQTSSNGRRNACAALLLLASLALTPGCYLSSDAKALETRVLHLEEQQQEFASTFSYTREELTTLVAQAEAQVRQLQATLEDARSILGQTNANLGVQVEAMEAKLAAIQGQLDAHRFGSEELQRGIETLRTDVEFRLEQLER